MTASPKQLLDMGNPNNVADAMSKADVGSGLALMTRTRRLTVASNIAVLPSDSKAVAILACFVEAGTLTGWFTPVKPQLAPSTGNVAVNASGDIEFASADAVTMAEVVYIAAEGDIITETVDVAANVGTLLGSRRAMFLISTVAVAGGLAAGTTGLVKGRAASVTNTTRFCCLNLAGTGVIFAATDAVTRATITYVAMPGQGTAPPDFVNRLTGYDVTGTPTV